MMAVDLRNKLTGGVVGEDAAYYRALKALREAGFESASCTWDEVSTMYHTKSVSDQWRQYCANDKSWTYECDIDCGEDVRVEYIVTQEAHDHFDVFRRMFYPEGSMTYLVVKEGKVVEKEGGERFDTFVFSPDEGMDSLVEAVNLVLSVIGLEKEMQKFCDDVFEGLETLHQK